MKQKKITLNPRGYSNFSKKSPNTEVLEEKYIKMGEGGIKRSEI